MVVRRNDTALKLPLKYRTTGLSEAHTKLYNGYSNISCESLQHKKEVYQRLGLNCGIIPCLNLSGISIQMAIMENRNLNDYLAQHRPAKPAQLAWFREMARTLIHIHDLCVIVADIATRNFLLAANLSVKFLDFTESSILPLGTDMQAADDAGYSIYTDIGQLGAVMYEVVTGEPYHFDLYKGQLAGPAIAAWPRREDLPSTQDIWLDSIIETC